MKKIILILILLSAFVLRLYRFDFPIGDWHSWRQADTSAVSRNFVKRGFDVLHPRFDDLSNVASGQINLEGYRFVEFPVYNVLQAGLFRALPFFTLEVWGRLVSIIASLGSLIFLYLIVRKRLGEAIALLSAFFFAVLPFNVFYGRVILPEPLMVMTSLGMMYFFDRWIGQKPKTNPPAGGQKPKTQTKNSKTIFFLLAVVFLSLSLLLKPYALVLILPIAYLVWQRWRLNRLKWFTLLLSCSLTLLPFLAWRWWMARFPEGIPVYDWLFNEGGIRFKGAFFYWLFAERISKLILGYWGVVFLGLGLIVKSGKKEGLFFFTWLVAILTYFVIIAGGNVKHDYYQVIAIPIISVFLAKGAHFLLTAPKRYFSRFTSHVLLVTCILFMFAFSWYQVRDYFNINNEVIVEAGRAVDQLVPKNAKVIAPYGGDTAFLYQTNRQGWPVGIEIEKMVNLGAQYYVNVNFGPETEWLMAKYCPIEKTDDWVIIDLSKKCDFFEE